MAKKPSKKPSRRPVKFRPTINVLSDRQLLAILTKNAEDEAAAFLSRFRVLRQLTERLKLAAGAKKGNK